MRRKDLTILTSVWFVTALLTLVLNDFVLKAYYHNWLTGKLSDFAGLFVFALFWTALLPKHKRVIFVLTAAFFVFWKSPYSQFIIDAWNGLGAFSIGRVIDATDLVALAVLPIAYIHHARTDRVWKLRVAPILPLVLSCFALMATPARSMVNVAREYSFDFSKRELEERVRDLDDVDCSEFSRDTINATIDDDDFMGPDRSCGADEYDAYIILSGDKTRSKLTLVDFRYMCPMWPNDSMMLIRSFERVVIKQLRTP